MSEGMNHRDLGLEAELALGAATKRQLIQLTVVITSAAVPCQREHIPGTTLGQRPKLQ